MKGPCETLFLHIFPNISANSLLGSDFNWRVQLRLSKLYTPPSQILPPVQGSPLQLAPPHIAGCWENLVKWFELSTLSGSNWNSGVYKSSDIKFYTVDRFQLAPFFHFASFSEAMSFKGISGTAWNTSTVEYFSLWSRLWCVHWVENPKNFLGVLHRLLSISQKFAIDCRFLVRWPWSQEDHSWGTNFWSTFQITIFNFLNLMKANAASVSITMRTKKNVFNLEVSPSARPFGVMCGPHRQQGHWWLPETAMNVFCSVGCVDCYHDLYNAMYRQNQKTTTRNFLSPENDKCIVSRLFHPSN